MKDALPPNEHAKSLAGEVAIVTGTSRSRGIGAAICRALAAQGADIFFTYWSNYDRGMPWGSENDFPDQFGKELRALGVEVESIEADLTTGVTGLLDAVEKRFRAASILVNNACYSVPDSVETLTAHILDETYAVNVRVPILLSVEFIKRFGGQGARRIISLTSGQSRGSMKGALAYASTKGALDAFTITFAAEVAHFGVTVNALDPGPTDSGWMTYEMKKALEPRFGLGRIGLPADAASLVVFLAGAGADWITGQVIHSRGGFE